MIQKYGGVRCHALKREIKIQRGPLSEVPVSKRAPSIGFYQRKKAVIEANKQKAPAWGANQLKKVIPIVKSNPVKKPVFAARVDLFKKVMSLIPNRAVLGAAVPL